VSELRHALRSLVKSPSFTLVAILSLALGIGINAGVYSLARAVLLDPLPIPDPGSLVALGWNGGPSATRSFLSIGSTAYRDEAGAGYGSNFSSSMYRSFQHVVGRDLCAFSYAATDVNVVTATRTIPASNLLVSGNFFRVLGVTTMIGRSITPSDDQPGAALVGVLTYPFWIHAFGGDPTVLNRVIRVNGYPFTVIGIAAPSFYGMSRAGFFKPTDIMLPLVSEPLVYTRSVPRSLFEAEDKAWLQLMMRVPPAEPTSPVDAALTTTFRAAVLGSSNANLRSVSAGRVRLFRAPRGLDSWSRQLREPLLLLTLTAVVVLLIACVNVGNLMLVRSLARQKELSIRAALGSGPWRLVRGTLIEAAVITAAGGALGLLFGLWSARALIAMLVADSAHAAVHAGLNARFAGVTAVLSASAALLFSAVPAMWVARRPLSPALKEVSTGASPHRLTAGRALMAAQVAISVPLLVGGMLFLRTVYNLGHVPLGFAPDRLLIFRIDPSLNGYDSGRVEQLYGRLVERLNSVPGVGQTTLSDIVLMSGLQNNWTFTGADGSEQSAKFARVGPDFFETFGIPLLSGRTIGAGDHSGAPRVAVLNEAAARSLFPKSEPLSQRLVMRSNPPADFEIVGIVQNSRYTSPRDPMPPIVYLPYAQTALGTLGAMNVIVRTEVPPDTAVDEIRRAVASVDPNIAITQMKTESDQIDETLGTERTFMRLLVAFGGFAVLLAAIGLHGLTAYSVVRRTGEIGVRVALGARRSHVLWLMLRQVLGITLIGMAVGIPSAVAAARGIRASLFGVAPADALSVTAAAALMILAAFTAGIFPAWRAARLDPLVALREHV
jgi:macrolide transport system ATP-binding/permease protein